MLRDLEERFGPTLNAFETPLALFRARHFMDEIEDYWERGPGSTVPEFTDYMHVLAVYGWDRNEIKVIAKIEAQGVRITPEILVLADNACLILPVHPELDVARENAASGSNSKIGTTGRGIGPVA